MEFTKFSDEFLYQKLQDDHQKPLGFILKQLNSGGFFSYRDELPLLVSAESLFFNKHWKFKKKRLSSEELQEVAAAYAT